MRIKKLSGTFGKLKNATLEPGGGMTVISAPNEYGKSTWCRLLTAMLYGVDTSERDKAGHLSVKTMCKPWDGGAVVGTMEVEDSGKSITLQRTTKNGAPMKNLVAVYTGTAEFIKGLDPDTVGRQLTGVSRQVFERTALISRPELRVSQTAELERKIADIVSTGDENTSFTESSELLKKWQRRLRFNKSGAIPALEQELREANHDFSLIESSSEEIAGLRTAMARQEKQIELLEEDLRTHDKLDARAVQRRMAEAKKAAEAAERRVGELTGAITKNGHVMTREDISSIRETAAAVMPLKKVSYDAERALWRAEKELADAATRREASPLNGKSEAEVSAHIARGRELAQRAAETKEPHVPLAIPVILCGLAFLGLIAATGILSPLFRGGALEGVFSFHIWGVIASLVVAAAGLVLFFVKPTRRRGAAEELAELLDSYGVGDVEKLSSLLSAYTLLTREEEARRAARDAARESYESAGAAAQKAEAEAVEKIEAFMPGVTSGEAILEALAETERNIDALTKAQFDAVSARNVYETLLQENGQEGEPDDSFLPVPIRNREDTRAALERARQQLTDATRAYDLATGAQRTLGDPSVVEGRIQNLGEEIEELKRRYSALTLAVEALSEANTKLQTRFSPEVSRRAGEIMSHLTGGRYDRLYFDKGFDAAAREEGSVETHNVLALSDGTADEIYLSLRLAMCELILGGDDPCPIVLDDALANFDDSRCGRALDVLLEMSKKRQVILFSCHTREADMLEGKEGVKVIRA